jgi:hypothetical protein
LKEKHPSETPNKTVMILQHSKDYKKCIWNITMMTEALNIFNVKLDASTGKVMESSLKSAMSLRKELNDNK